MGISFLNSFDLLRVMSGTLAANLLFNMHNAPRRQRFFLRSIVGFSVALVYSQLYYILEYLLKPIAGSFAALFVTYIWWLSITVLALAYIAFCYGVYVSDLLFRGVLAVALESITTVVVRYWIVMTLWPDFPEKMPALYVFVTVGVYVLIYSAFYFFFIRPHRADGVFSVVRSKKTIVLNSVVLILLTLLVHTMGGVFDEFISKLSPYEDLAGVHIVLQYFCMGLHLFACIAIFIILYVVNGIGRERDEKAFLEQLVRGKERQYFMAKSTVETLKKLSHDLKYQIHAWEKMESDERKAALQEAKGAVQLFDSIVNTDNDALNALLTEKSLYCSNNKIKFTCMVNTAELKFIKILDLYVLLGNALDNAIECVQRFADDDKKTISLTIGTAGHFLNINIENYYEGNIILNNGMPVSSKARSEFHGYGLKSIREIVYRYGGDIRISTEEQVFSLQVLIPIPPPQE